MAAPPATAGRTEALRSLRRLHGWIGLWGASLGLLFGTTGILLNHRAVLKIPAAHAQESTAQLPLPHPAPADATAWSEWLQGEIGWRAPASRVKADPAQPVAWGPRELTQPEKWTATFSGPGGNVTAEYWVGNGYTSVKRSEQNAWGTLMNFHKGSGMGIGWILLVDTLAGSILVLSITGVILWTQLNRRRVTGVAIAGTSLGLVLYLTLSAL